MATPLIPIACPYCGSHDLESTAHYLDITGDTPQMDLFCNDCHSSVPIPVDDDDE